MSDKWEPLVSIIIPVYNGSNYLKEAIDCALSQSYGNIEVIVVNDGSNDSGTTEKIAKSYGNTIRYYEKENGGVSSALNYGIEKMNGEYFSWLSHDDKYLPDKIAAEIEALRLCEDKRVVVICGSKQIDFESKELAPIRHNRKYEWQKYAVGKTIPWYKALADVIEHGSYSGCALLIPKEVFREVGLFDERLRYCQDLLMWMNIFAHGYNLVRAEGVHVCCRVHSKQLTQTGNHMFHSDCLEMSKTITPLLCKKSDANHNFLMSYAKYNALYNNPEAVEYVLSTAREHGLNDFRSVVKIRLIEMYGKVRPWIRKMYYSLFRKIKTN